MIVYVCARCRSFARCTYPICHCYFCSYHTHLIRKMLRLWLFDQIAILCKSFLIITVKILCEVCHPECNQKWKRLITPTESSSKQFEIRSNHYSNLLLEFFIKADVIFAGIGFCFEWQILLWNCVHFQKLFAMYGVIYVMICSAVSLQKIREKKLQW